MFKGKKVATHHRQSQLHPDDARARNCPYELQVARHTTWSVHSTRSALRNCVNDKFDEADERQLV